MITLQPVAAAEVEPKVDVEPEVECLRVEQAFATNHLTELTSLELQSPQWQALQQFRLAAIYIPQDERKLARGAIRNGLEIVKKALKEEPDNVEILLLGAMLDGQYLLLSPWRYFHNGRRGFRRLGRAEDIEPDNPRAVLIKATAKVVLPKIFGGNTKTAIALFSQALAQATPSGRRFESSTLCDAGQWAQVDILNWLGRAYDKQSNHDQAKRAYQRALDRSPDNHWVKLALAGAGYEWKQEE